MTWYLNELALEKVNVTSRQIDTPWATFDHPIYDNHSVIGSPNAKAQPITITIQAYGSDRFATESSIRAEVEDSLSLYIESTTNNIYQDRKFAWITPSRLSVDDSGGDAPLKVNIAGFLDERTIHSCDFTTNWTSSITGAISSSAIFPLIFPIIVASESETSSLATSSSTRYKKYSIRSPLANHMTYTPPEALDLTTANRLCGWLKCDNSSATVGTCHAEILTGEYYSYWDLTFDAATWTYFDCDLNSADGSSGTSPTISSITAVRFNFENDDYTKYVYVGWVFVE